MTAAQAESPSFLVAAFYAFTSLAPLLYEHNASHTSCACILPRWRAEGGLGLWTPSPAHGTLQDPPLGPWTSRAAQGTLEEGGGWTLDFKKTPNRILGGGCYKVTIV